MQAQKTDLVSYFDSRILKYTYLNNFDLLKKVLKLQVEKRTS